MAISGTAHEQIPVSDIDNEIKAHGVQVSLRRGIQCPCHSEQTRQPDPNCNLCEGWGFIWNTGVDAIAFGPNRRINRMYEDPGTIDLCDAFFSFPSGTFISHMDRFSVPMEIIAYSEIFTKGEVNKITGGSLEKSRFARIITPVDQAVWIERSPSSGQPYSYTQHNLIEGTDFRIINSNQVDWLSGGSSPSTGARYSLRFRTEAEYVAWAPRARAEGTHAYPAQWLCKRVDFIKARQ